jgi:DinB superfamily
MKRSDIQQMPEYFDRYINLVADEDIIVALQDSLDYLNTIPLTKWQMLGDKVYAEGKWTVKDIIQHITDTERIFSYRALRFSRNDTTLLPGFDENLFAANAHANNRALEDLVAELIAVRESTLALYKSFSPEMLCKTGAAFKGPISVLAIGFTAIGHQIHHINILEERYYPLLN